MVDLLPLQCIIMVTQEETIMYKCSAKAQLVIDQVIERCKADSQTENTWNGKSGTYMFIPGRENADGKATGVVHKMQSDGTHKLCGSYKILADGNITRFTGLSKADWNSAMENADAEYKAKYEATTEPVTEQKVAV